MRERCSISPRSRWRASSLSPRSSSISGTIRPTRRPLLLEHRDLVDQRALAVDLLDLVGEDVLAAGEHDQFLAAAADVQIAVRVELPEVAGAEKAVRGEGFGGRLGIVPVALEHVGAARLDLALPVRRLRAFLVSFLGRRDAQLDALDRDARGVEPGAAGRVEGQDRRGLGQAIAGQHLPAEAFEAPGDLGVEPGAARGEQPERRPEAPVQRPEQAPPELPAEARPQRHRERQQTLEGRPHQPAREAALDAGEHRLVEPRHRDHDRAAALGQRARDLGTGDAARQHHRGARGEPGQQPDRERIGVMQRQRQQRAIARPGQALLQQRPDVGRDVRVAERHPLGRAGGAGGVDEHREARRIDRRQAPSVVARRGPASSAPPWIGAPCRPCPRHRAGSAPAPAYPRTARGRRTS